MFYRQTDRKHTHLKKKIPKTTPGPTRILNLNFSSIGSVVLEQDEKRLFGVPTDKQLDKQTHFKKYPKQLSDQHGSCV